MGDIVTPMYLHSGCQGMKVATNYKSLTLLEANNYDHTFSKAAWVTKWKPVVSQSCRLFFFFFPLCKNCLGTTLTSLANQILSLP